VAFGKQTVRDRHAQLLRCRLMLLVRKARKIVQQSCRNGRLAAIHNWRPLAEGNIPFAIRYTGAVIDVNGGMLIH